MWRSFGEVSGRTFGGGKREKEKDAVPRSLWSEGETMVEVDDEGNAASWGEHVTDEEYAAAPSIDET
jgi:hypothetical protein